MSCDGPPGVMPGVGEAKDEIVEGTGIGEKTMVWLTPDFANVTLPDDGIAE